MVGTRPSVMSLLPKVVEGPRELGAANVVLGWLDGVSTLLGPAITAVCISVSGFAAPLVVFAGLAGITAVLAAGVGTDHDEAADPGSRPTPEPVTSNLTALAAVLRSPGSRAALFVLAAHSFVLGALDLLFVVIAVDLLHRSSADAGWLNAAFGIGSVVGGLAVALLIGRRRIWLLVAFGAAVLAVSLVVLGHLPDVGWASVGFVVCGSGAAAVLIGTRTMLQRIAPLRLLCHTFALVESAEMVMLMVGAAAVPADGIPAR